MRMSYELHREVAKELFPELDLSGCYKAIFARIKDVRPLIDGKVILSEWAYQWALLIGDRDVMIDRVTDSEWAYRWARDIGDADVMIDRVTESYWAYMWALFIGNHDVMLARAGFSAAQQLP